MIDHFLPCCGIFLTVVPLCHSKHSLGSHEYVQNCRKWENEITLQLLSHSTMRRDLARTVSHFINLGHNLLMVASRQHSDLLSTFSPLKH